MCRRAIRQLADVARVDAQALTDVVPAIVASLGDRDDGIRFWAVEALRPIRIAGTTQALATVLKDPNREVALDAALALAAQDWDSVVAEGGAAVLGADLDEPVGANVGFFKSRPLVDAARWIATVLRVDLRGSVRERPDRLQPASRRGGGDLLDHDRAQNGGLRDIVAVTSLARMAVVVQLVANLVLLRTVSGS